MSSRVASSLGAAGALRCLGGLEESHAAVVEARRGGRRVGLVPTMGALHDGHLSLVRASRDECDYTVVTIFVNPAQFAPHEDFHKYPRTLEADLDALGKCGVDLVFAPLADSMYPPGFSTFVDPPRVAEPLEGRCRPGHFRGVTTIVLKLFHLLPADIAYFGQKDYQQCLVIRRMVEDLNVPITIRMCPTVREPDGLAMSSRNRYLSPEERRQAVWLSRSLRRAGQLVAEGQRDAHAIAREMEGMLRAAGITRIDYVAVTDAETLQPVSRIGNKAMAMVAAHVGSTRLIDNCQLHAGT